MANFSKLDAAKEIKLDMYCAVTKLMEGAEQEQDKIQAKKSLSHSFQCPFHLSHPQRPIQTDKLCTMH